jgi:hypothetical protein
MDESSSTRGSESLSWRVHLYHYDGAGGCPHQVIVARLSAGKDSVVVHTENNQYIRERKAAEREEEAKNTAGIIHLTAPRSSRAPTRARHARPVRATDNRPHRRPAYCQLRCLPLTRELRRT